MAEFDHDWNDTSIANPDVEDELRWRLEEAERLIYVRMYGETKYDIEEYLMNEDTPYNLCMSMLSKALHVMDFDELQAKHLINKVKYVMYKSFNDNPKSDSGLTN